MLTESVILTALPAGIDRDQAFARVTCFVTLRASGDEEKATITVLDNGRGIALEDQAKVFDRFHGALGTAHSDAALGLGLPLTRQFIEAHGGTVELESAKGKGTTVILTIPRKPK